MCINITNQMCIESILDRVMPLWRIAHTSQTLSADDFGPQRYLLLKEVAKYDRQTGEKYIDTVPCFDTDLSVYRTKLTPTVVDGVYLDPETGYKYYEGDHINRLPEGDEHKISKSLGKKARKQLTEDEQKWLTCHEAYLPQMDDGNKVGEWHKVNTIVTTKDGGTRDIVVDSSTAFQWGEDYNEPIDTSDTRKEYGFWAGIKNKLKTNPVGAITKINNCNDRWINKPITVIKGVNIYRGSKRIHKIAPVTITTKEYLKDYMLGIITPNTDKDRLNMLKIKEHAESIKEFKYSYNIHKFNLNGEYYHLQHTFYTDQLYKDINKQPLLLEYKADIKEVFIDIYKPNKDVDGIIVAWSKTNATITNFIKRPYQTFIQGTSIVKDLITSSKKKGYKVTSRKMYQLFKPLDKWTASKIMKHNADIYIKITTITTYKEPVSKIIHHYLDKNPNTQNSNCILSTNR